MLQKLAAVEEKFNSINEMLYDGAVACDPEKYSSLMKEFKTLEPVVLKYREYKKVTEDLESAKELLNESGLDKELKEMAQLEIEEAKENQSEIFEQLKILLLPKDPNDERNVIIEIRGGAGGEESALFASVLYRMYCMYAEARRWKTEILSLNETELGGIKEVSFMISGEGA